MKARGLKESDMLPMVKIAEGMKMRELIVEAEASLSF
jgi:hypothetical protein